MRSMLAPAFSDPVLQSQSVFRIIMQAMARPGIVQPLHCAIVPPQPLPAGLAAIALALADYETPLWLDPPLAASDAVRSWLRFHTGATIVDDPAEASFALVSDALEVPDFSAFSIGLPDYPDRSATLIVQVENFAQGAALTLSGPGIKGEQILRATPLPVDFADQAAANRALFPQGIDCLLVSDEGVAGLPRTTIVTKRG